MLGPDAAGRPVNKGMPSRRHRIGYGFGRGAVVCLASKQEVDDGLGRTAVAENFVHGDTHRDISVLRTDLRKHIKRLRGILTGEIFAEHLKSKNQQCAGGSLLGLRRLAVLQFSDEKSPPIPLCAVGL